MDSPNLNFHFPRCYGGLLAESVEAGDEIKSCSRSSRTTVTQCCVLKALFSLVWHTKMSSVFGTGQSTNSMARIMKAYQMSKVCASSHEYPHVEKNQESSWTEFQRYGGPTDCHGKRNNLGAKRKTSRQKEKPQCKKKNLTAKRKRLRAKRITSREKEKDSRQKE